MRRPSGLMLVGLLAVIAMVHLHRLNQLGRWVEYASSSSSTVKRRVDSQSTSTAPVAVGLAVPAIVIADEAQQQASVRQQQQEPPPQRTTTTTTTQPQQPRNCTNFTTTTTAPEWLKIHGYQARWLHIGKAGGGTFSNRLRTKWRVNMWECHPNPCNITSSDGIDKYMSAILIRDPVDRFVSAFYWRAAVLCYQAGYLCDPVRYPPPRKHAGEPDSKKEIEINLIFNQSRTNVNTLAQRLCRHGDDDAYQQAALDVRKIGHLRATTMDWLEQSHVTVAAAAAAAAESVSSFLTPIVLERGFDFNSQIDAFVQQVVVNHTQVEDADSASFANRLAYIQQEDCLEEKSKRKRTINASPKGNKSIPLSEENIKCVARFYLQDYQAIRDLGQTHCTTQECRLGIESIWNRRAHLLLS